MHANRIVHALADLFLGHARLLAPRANQGGDRLVAGAHMFLAHQEADFKLWNLKIAHAAATLPAGGRQPAQSDLPFPIRRRSSPWPCAPPGRPQDSRSDRCARNAPVSYTHLTLPTKRIV